MGRRPPLRLLWRVRALRVRRRARGWVRIERSVRIDRGVRIEVERGGRLAVGRNTHLERGARIFVRAGVVELGAGMAVGESSTIIAVERITIHDRVRLGARSAVIDFGPGADASELPLRKQRVSSRAISIGEGAELGAASAVRAGAAIPAGGSVAPGALVGLHDGALSHAQSAAEKL